MINLIKLFKSVPFSLWLKDQKLSMSEILEVLLNNTFTLRDNHDGSNYYSFLDKDGFLKFNNPRMVLEADRLTAGVTIDGGRTSNTIRFNNLNIILSEIAKKDIVDRYLFAQEQIRILEEEKKELNEMLDYLIFTNKTNFILKDYKEFSKERIAETLLKTKTSLIAKIKN